METIDQLAADLALARQVENEARESRVALENKIIDLMQLGADERKTVKTGNGLKLTCSTGYTYTLAKEFDRAVVPHRVKYELDKSAYNKLEGEAKAKASEFVTTKPKKPSVTLAVL